MAVLCANAGNPTVAKPRMQRDAVVRTLRTNAHYVVSCLLALAIIPIFKAAGLHLAVNWQRLIPAYWVGLAAHSILVAVLMAVIGLPPALTVRPFLSRFTRQKARLLIF